MDSLSFPLMTHLVPTAILMFVGVILLLSLVLQLLWNSTIPQIFALKEITFWQSLRLLIIAWILFGRFGS
ncbi:hypothetical protein [Desulforamulus ruminis]|uniref:hypothetical protein n=1 Tax=Desulforamulus ruminis TaxID=1564 RepID=UPI002353A162|nr:hypothetical protein [Desulforamulus ruminis]